MRGTRQLLQALGAAALMALATGIIYAALSLFGQPIKAAIENSATTVALLFFA